MTIKNMLKIFTRCIAIFIQKEKKISCKNKNDLFSFFTIDIYKKRNRTHSIRKIHVAVERFFARHIYEYHTYVDLW